MILCRGSSGETSGADRGGSNLGDVFGRPFGDL